MKKYTTEVIAEGELTKELNLASDEGWQLDQVVYAYDRNYLVIWSKASEAAAVAR
jgi:hypothetical protein